MRVFDDNHIHSAIDDHFGFREFADVLGDSILDTEVLPLTVGIFGEWGTGKTSLMSLLNAKLALKCKTIWFNPWKYDNKEQLWSALIQTVLLKIRKDATSESLRSKAWRVFRGTAWFMFKKGVATLSSNFLTEADLESLRDASADNAARDHDFLDGFEAEFRSIVEEYVSSSGRLVIFIDDLDRCIPENAITVLESLKLYLDQSRCVFVVGMDREIVERGIQHRYGGRIPITGKEYLEKIIQIPFFLPPVQFEQLKRALTRYEIVAGYSDEIWQLVRLGLNGNPRKAKRFANSFFMARQVATRSLMDDADEESGGPEDEQGHTLYYLAKVLVLQLSFPEFYSYLIGHMGSWESYEELFQKDQSGRSKYFDNDAGLRRFYEDDWLRLFMRETQEAQGFPPAPSEETLGYILQFAGIVGDLGSNETQPGKEGAESRPERISEQASGRAKPNEKKVTPRKKK